MLTTTSVQIKELALFEVLQYDCALVQRPGRRVRVELESRYEAFGGYVEEVLRFFVRVYFVCHVWVSRLGVLVLVGWDLQY